MSYTCPDGGWECADDVNEIVKVMQDRIDQLAQSQTDAYAERDRLVAALSHLFPSYLTKHPEAEGWDEEWRNIVVLNIPDPKIRYGSLQLSWHIHASELPWFEHLKFEENHWDGHTVAEKYARLATLRKVDPDGCTVCGE